MENDANQKRFESVYSTKVRAGRRRTYFFDVRKTKGEDFYVTLTESTKRFDSDGYDRHKIFLYKEDFNRFLSSLTEVIDHVKTDLMPDYDYGEFERRQAEWEAKQAEEEAAEAANPRVSETVAEKTESTAEEPESGAEENVTEDPDKGADAEEEDMSW